MMAKQRDQHLTFTVPAISPRAYLCRGPSGWPESFKRDALDRELAAFVAPARVSELVDVFITARELSEHRRTAIDWYTIVGFLGRTMNCLPTMVPHTVGIAFWAHVVLAEESKGSN